MYELSQTDRRIIHALGENARQSYEQIARSIKSKKPVVAYHIQKLLDEGIITKFVPVVSLSRLGIYAFKMYFRLHGLDKEQHGRLIHDLANDPHVNWVAEGIGAWDLLISVYARNVLEFAQRKAKFLAQYSRFIEEYAITILEDALVFNRDYLVKSKEFRQEYVFGGIPRIEETDEEQRLLLRLISNDGRFKAVKLAQKADLDVRTVVTKIRDLEKRGIIQGYTVFLDLEKIGMQLHKLCIYLENFTQKEYDSLVAYCKTQPDVVHIIKSLGAWELEMEIESSIPVHGFTTDLKERFPSIIRKIDQITISKEHKLDFFPQWL